MTETVGTYRRGAPAAGDLRPRRHPDRLGAGHRVQLPARTRRDRRRRARRRSGQPDRRPAHASHAARDGARRGRRRGDRRLPGRLHRPRLGDEQPLRRHCRAARRSAGRRRAAGGGHLEGRADGAADPRALRARRAFRGHRRRQRRRLHGRPSPMWSRTHSPNCTRCPTGC